MAEIAHRTAPAVHVTDVFRAREELETNGVEISSWRVDGETASRSKCSSSLRPDGLWYYFYQPLV